MLLGDVDSIHINTIFEPPLVFGYQNIISAHLPLAHSAVLSERPVLKTVTPLPLHAIMRVLILVPELHRDLVIGECEQLLAQAVVLFLLPFLGQEVNNRICAREESVAVPPDGVGCVRFRACNGMPGLSE